ncbi:hypothetical protein G7046_g3744 [Stylonectria norvegica]|nr:hypothetical protein G7046_g3744 [Stylonectria norvegica]
MQLSRFAVGRYCHHAVLAGLQYRIHVKGYHGYVDFFANTRNAANSVLTASSPWLKETETMMFKHHSRGDEAWPLSGSEAPSIVYETEKTDSFFDFQSETTDSVHDIYPYGDEDLFQDIDSIQYEKLFGDRNPFEDSINSSEDITDCFRDDESIDPLDTKRKSLDVSTFCNSEHGTHEAVAATKKDEHLSTYLKRGDTIETCHYPEIEEPVNPARVLTRNDLRNQRIMFLGSIILLNIIMVMVTVFGKKSKLTLVMIAFIKSKDFLSSIVSPAGMAFRWIHLIFRPLKPVPQLWILSLIPAYSESEEQIVKTVYSLRDNDVEPHRQVMVIVLDGNPRDVKAHMTKVIRQFERPYVSLKWKKGVLRIISGFMEDVPVIVIEKLKNGGKKDSLILCHDLFNFPRENCPSYTKLLREEMWRDILPSLTEGTSFTGFDMVFCTDADSTIYKGAIAKLADALARDKNAIAACGLVLVELEPGFEWSFWNLYQQFQYTFGQYVRRRAEGFIGKVTCLPGCITMIAVREEMAGAIQAYAEPITAYLVLAHQVQYLGTDRRLTYSMLSQGKHLRTLFVPDAVSETVAPQSVAHYLSQRRRWGSNAYFNNYFYLAGTNMIPITRIAASVEVIRLSLVYYRVLNTSLFIWGLIKHADVMKLIPMLVIGQMPTMWFYFSIMIDPELRKRAHKLVLGYCINKCISPFMSVIIFTKVATNLAWGMSGVTASSAAPAAAEGAEANTADPGSSATTLEWDKIVTPRGDRLPDFSYCGYHSSELSLPDISSTPASVLNPTKGDQTKQIQAALDKVATDGGGVVSLTGGNFSISSGLQIPKSVTLRGLGPDKTKLLVIKQPSVPVITMGTGGGSVKVLLRAPITDSYVPIGTSVVTVGSTKGFSEGQTVFIQRAVTADWVRYNGMSNLTRDGVSQTWIRVGTLIQQPNVILLLNDTQITLQSPLTDSLEAEYMKPEIVAYSPPPLSSEMGIEGLSIHLTNSCSSSPVDNATCNGAAVSFSPWAVDSWARNLNLTGFNQFVDIGYNSARITVQDVAMFRDADTTEVALPNDIWIKGSRILVQDCGQYGSATAKTFSVLTGSLAPGPNVVLRHVTQSKVQYIYPHQRWAHGLLVEETSAPTWFYNRNNYGSGQGWSMNGGVGWNLEGQAVIESAPLGVNWCIGCQGVEQSGNGTFVEKGVGVTPKSLFQAQLQARGFGQK